MAKTSTTSSNQGEKKWLDDALKAIRHEQERQTYFLKIATVALVALAVITLLVLGATVCSTLGVFFL